MAHINWQSGRIDLPSDVDMGSAWSLVVAGDWAPLGEPILPRIYDPTEILVRDPMRFYGDVRSVLQDADLAMVNLEGVVGNAGKPVVKDGLHLRLPTAAIEGLVAGSFRLACLANNHSMDFGPDGLAHTRQLLSERGISWVGAGLDGQEACQPFVTQVGGVQLAVVNAAEGEEGRSLNGGPGVADFDQDRLVRQIATLRERVDVVVAVLHAGREFVPVPPPYVQRTYRALVDAGADLVVGHHPHVPQGVEVYQGRPIAYSLANFALWQPSGSPFRRLGYMVKGNFRGVQLTSVEIVPYRIGGSGLALLTGHERAAFLADLARVSNLLPDTSKVEAVWCAYADRWLERSLAEDLIAISSLLLEEADLRTAWLSAFSGRRDAWAKLARWSVRTLARLAARLTDGQSDQRRARGAAILRNRSDTPAHRELYLTALQKCMNPQREPEPDWALNLIERWEVFGF